MHMLPAVVPSCRRLCKSNFYSRHPRSQANLTSWRKRTSMRKGHKVKQIMCWRYQADIRRVSVFVFVFACLKFSNGPIQFPRLPVLSLLATFQGVRSPWPRARPRDSTVSTNAFRAALHGFSGVSQAAASADCNQIQSGIKRRS